MLVVTADGHTPACITRSQSPVSFALLLASEILLFSVLSCGRLPADIAVGLISLLLCGDEDHAGSTMRYNKAWHKKSGLPLLWIKGAGHNSNTDEPEQVNQLIELFIEEKIII